MTPGAKETSTYLLIKHLKKKKVLGRSPPGLVWKPKEFKAWAWTAVKAAKKQLRDRAQA